MTTETAPRSYTDQAMNLARSILAEQAHKRDFNPDDSLTDVGLSSLDLVNLMVAIEAEFDIMIPPSQLTPETFRSISSIARMVEALRGPVVSH
jgi:acyl carrier protein